MRQLVLTKLGEETDLASGETSYLLVFNGGDLRVPVTEEAARAVILFMQSGEGQPYQEPRAPQTRSAPVPQIDTDSLPPDHGMAQRPFEHPMPPRQPQQVSRNGDYARPPAVPDPTDEDEAGAPQF